MSDHMSIEAEAQAQSIMALLDEWNRCFSQRLGERFDYDASIAVARQTIEAMGPAEAEGTVHWQAVEGARAMEKLFTKMKGKCSGERYGFFAYNKDLRAAKRGIEALGMMMMALCEPPASMD